VTDIDAALVQQVVNLSKGQKKTDAHHQCQADDFYATFEITKCIRFDNQAKLRNRPYPLKPASFERAGYCLAAFLPERFEADDHIH